MAVEQFSVISCQLSVENKGATLKNKFEKIRAWGKAHQLTLEIYKISEAYPIAEKYGLSSQLRRSCASIPTNIAEGSAKNSYKDYLRFLNIAKGSLEETKYHILLSRDLGYITNEKYNDLQEKADEVGKMMYSLACAVYRRNHSH